MMYKDDSGPLKHITLSHATVVAHLAIYAELPEDVRREVDAHLSVCSDCTETWAAYQQQDQMVSDLMARRESMVARYGTARRMQGETALEALRQRAQVQRLQPWWVAWPVRLRDFLRPAGAVTLATVAALVVIVALVSFLLPSNQWDRALRLVSPPTPVSEDSPWAASEGRPHLDVAAGIEAALERELAAWGAFSTENLARYLDMETSAAWRYRIQEDVEQFSRDTPPARAAILHLRVLAPDLAIAGIRFYISDLPADHQPIRSRFYRQIEGAWYWSEPKPVYWGKPLQIETAHFLLRFRELDTMAAGQAIAETLENAYVRLHETLGVIPEDQTFVVELHPSDDIPALQQVAANHFRAASPVFRAPILSNGAYDSRQYAASLFFEMYVDLLHGEPLPLGADGEPMHIPHDRFVQEIGFRAWLAAHSTETDPPFPLPETRFKEFVGLHTPLGLETLFLRNVSPEESFQLAFTLYAYAAERYGVEQTVALARAMYGGEDDWGVIIPEIFGLSQLVFETDWNVWLRAPELPGPPAESVAHDAVWRGIEDALARELAVWGSTAPEDLAQYIDDEVSAAWWGQQVRDIKWETGRFEGPPHRAWIHSIETSPLHTYSTQEPRPPAPVFVTLAFFYNDDAQPSVKRVGRIYRQIGERWYWTQPQPEYWGWGRTLYTDNFLFEYRAMDWAPVEGVAEILERGHQCLAGLVDIEPTRVPMLDGLFGIRKITIRFIPDDALLPISPVGDNIYQTESPFFRAPRLAGGHYDIEQYAGQLFYQMLATVYAEHLPFDYIGQPSILMDREWTAFQVGFQLWLTEYCTGVNYTLGMEDSAQDSSQPWVNAPAYRAFLLENLPFTLSDLESPRPLTVTVQTAQQLFAYVAEKHGRAAALAFAHTLVGQEDEWAVIIPHVLGISQAEFEADWNEWLDIHLRQIP